MKKCLRPLKFECDENNIFFWGCLHLNHDPQWEVPLWKKRGFNSILEHNQTIENNWKEKLNEDSIIFLLGDTSFGYCAEQYMSSFFSRVPFKECYWMSGNHAAGWSKFLDGSDESGITLIDNKLIQITPNYMEIHINDSRVVACHYPLTSWNGQGKGSFMVHAHVHGTLEKSELGKILYKSKIKEVSIEKQPFPISCGELRRHFN